MYGNQGFTGGVPNDTSMTMAGLPPALQRNMPTSGLMPTLAAGSAAPPTAPGPGMAPPGATTPGALAPPMPTMPPPGAPPVKPVPVGPSGYAVPFDAPSLADSLRQPPQAPTPQMQPQGATPMPMGGGALSGDVRGMPDGYADGGLVSALGLTRGLDPNDPYAAILSGRSLPMDRNSWADMLGSLYGRDKDGNFVNRGGVGPMMRGAIDGAGPPTGPVDLTATPGLGGAIGGALPQPPGALGPIVQNNPLAALPAATQQAAAGALPSIDVSQMPGAIDTGVSGGDRGNGPDPGRGLSPGRVGELSVVGALAPGLMGTAIGGINAAMGAAAASQQQAAMNTMTGIDKAPSFGATLSGMGMNPGFDNTGIEGLGGYGRAGVGGMTGLSNAMDPGVQGPARGMAHAAALEYAAALENQSGPEFGAGSASKAGAAPDFDQAQAVAGIGGSNWDGGRAAAGFDSGGNDTGGGPAGGPGGPGGGGSENDGPGGSGMGNADGGPIGALPPHRGGALDAVSGGYVAGPGDGKSDSIMVEGPDGGPNKLSDGEFVLTAPAVAALGRGSSKAGAKVLAKFMAALENGDVNAAIAVIKPVRAARG